MMSAAAPRTSRRAALALASGLALLLMAAPARAADPPPEFYGIVPQEAPTARDYTQMKRDGVGMMRILINWPWVEQTRGTYDWRSYDRAIGQITSQGIEVWPVLFGTPTWAQQPNARCQGACAPATGTARAAFAEFAAAAAERYGPGGDFWTEPSPVDPIDPPPCELPVICRPSAMVAPCECDTPVPIEVWQIWNEQNSPKYYGPKPHVGDYANLLKATADAIRSEQPEAEIVLGGMWGPPKTDAVVPVRRYLKKLLRDRGARTALDAIALHPYGADLRTVMGQVRDGRRLLDRGGAKGAGIWVTELGWASGGPRKESLVTTPGNQAKLLKKSFGRLIRKRGAWDIRGVHWYSWRDTRGGLCNWCPKSGLRKPSGKSKPAAKAFRKLPRAGA